MDKMKMHTPDLTDSNIEKIGRLFPNCLTERIGEDGKVERAIDFDQLRQELSKEIVEGPQERYQFTWPDKKKAIRLANTPSTMTLRPCREDSVDFDNTENLYIEGDNLEVLKLLREDYLSKVKMIYIDPPYNTGNDFVYEDDFAQGASDYFGSSGQTDSEGNRLVLNAESNGRFHTDWLNMIYPRLKIARDLLSKDGICFIAIDDHELFNLKKICDDVFGASNFMQLITRSTGTPTGGGFDGLVNEVDYMLIYAKSSPDATINGLPMSEEDSKIYDYIDEYGRYLIRPLRRTGGEDRREDRPTMFFPIEAPDGTQVYPYGPTGYESRWICSPETVEELKRNHLIYWKKAESSNGIKWTVYQKYYLENRTKAPGNLWDDVEGNKKATRDIRGLFDSKKVFDFPKPVSVLMKALRIASEKDSLILDFFSGSSTTAHAVMQLNSEDEGHRKYIMVQLNEETDPSTEAYKAGYKTICEIGKERIRRAGMKILEEYKKAETESGLFAKTESKPKLDVGFRVLKLDSSNMNDVYYRPEDFSSQLIKEDNVKEDRTPEDLLFQVMLECNLPLSAKIQTEKIAGKEVFTVNNGYLIACFDEDVNEEVIKAVAKRKPYYFIMRDKSLSSDNVTDNFEQIFQAYSKETIRRIL